MSLQTRPSGPDQDSYIALLDNAALFGLSKQRHHHHVAWSAWADHLVTCSDVVEVAPTATHGFIVHLRNERDAMLQSLPDLLRVVLDGVSRAQDVRHAFVDDC